MGDFLNTSNQPTQKTIIVQHEEHNNNTIGGATLFDWWQLGFVPLILAWFVYKGVKAKVDADNLARRQKAINEHKEPPSDKTIMNWAAEITARKNK